MEVLFCCFVHALFEINYQESYRELICDNQNWPFLEEGGEWRYAQYAGSWFLLSHKQNIFLGFIKILVMFFVTVLGKFVCLLLICLSEWQCFLCHGGKMEFDELEKKPDLVLTANFFEVSVPGVGS